MRAGDVRKKLHLVADRLVAFVVVEVAGVVADLVDARRDDLGEAVVLLKIDREVRGGLSPNVGERRRVLLSTAMRTMSAATDSNWRTCATVAATSDVLVAVMDCTATGCPEPTVAVPMVTDRVGFRTGQTPSLRTSAAVSQ